MAKYKVDYDPKTNTYFVKANGCRILESETFRQIMKDAQGMDVDVTDRAEAEERRRKGKR